METVFIELVLFRGQQIEKPRPEARLLQYPGHLAIPGAEAAAAAAMGKDHQGPGLPGQRPPAGEGFFVRFGIVGKGIDFG